MSDSAIITVSGLPGSGTTTLCALLQEQTGLPYVYAGQIFRAEAQRQGMNLADFGALCQADPEVDQALDSQQESLLLNAHKEGGLILEGRLSGWLARKVDVAALTIWVQCDEDERIRRIVDRDGADVASQREQTLAREASETDRYRRYYGIDLRDLTPYQLVIDSTEQTPAELVNQVMATLRSD